MSFIIQRIRGSQVTLVEVRGRTLRIGRGTNAQVRSENAAVALEHAVIEAIDGGFELIDRGSITGTYLNGRPVETSRLTAGDTVEIGDLRIGVQVAEPGKPLFLRVSSVESEDAWTAEEIRKSTRSGQEVAGGGALVAPRTDFVRAYRLRRALLSKTVLSILALTLAFLAIAWVVSRNRQREFMPGALSLAHSSAVLPDGTRVIPEDACDACHAPFGGPVDEKCLACHQKAFHQADFADPGTCISCHAEHRQIPHLAAVQHQECISCHRDLEDVPTRDLTVAASITSFATDHPEFTISPIRSSARIPVTSAEMAEAETTSLKFNHDCHLNGPCDQRPPTAADPRRVQTTLTCESCHAIDAQSGRFRPVSYSDACAECHVLTFDNRFPPVPHGIDLETVAGVIANAYSGNRDLLNRSAEEVIRTFAEGRARQLNVGSATVRNAQQVVKVRCLQCHGLNEARTSVLQPVQGHRWFDGVRSFDHTTHMSESMQLACVDCHEGITSSETASTLSLPSREVCAGCHRSTAEHAGRGLERCTTCHYYHELTTRFGSGWTARTAAVSPAPGGGTPGQDRATWRNPLRTIVTENTMITTVLSILLLMALIAIVALVSVARANRKSRAAARAAGAPRPPAAPVAPARTPAPAAPVASPREASSPVRKPAEPPAGSVQPEATVMMELPTPASAAAPAGGTEMIQWHGSLIGVVGPYAGKRIPIDEEGFYIGRDKEVSSIVVNDSRISRRHVWIGVRDGAVVAIEQGSTNGTFLNDVGSPRITRVPLKPGDVVILGDEVASFRYEP